MLPQNQPNEPTAPNAPTPPNHPTEPQSPAPHSDLWYLLTLLLFAALALAILFPPPKTDTDYSSGRSKVARIKGDMRTITIALETYYLDQNDYPAWATGADGANAFAPPNSQAYKVPTFRTRRGPGDSLITLTTPVAYITSYFADPFADVKGATFAYRTPGEGKGIGFIIWSPGPDGVYDINPDEDYSNIGLTTPSPSLTNHTYDPSNGTISGGDVYRYKQ